MTVSPRVILASVLGVSASLFLLVALFPSRLYTTLNGASYLVFHSTIELFSVVVSFSIFGEDRRFLGSLAMFTDITERKHAEQSISLLSFALDNVGEAAFLGSPR
jgi:hypothetical protein